MINGLTNVVLTRVDREASSLIGVQVDEDKVIQVPPNTDISQWIEVYFPSWKLYQILIRYHVLAHAGCSDAEEYLPTPVS